MAHFLFILCQAPPPRSDAELFSQRASLGRLSRRSSVAFQPSFKVLHQNLVHDRRLFHDDRNRRQSGSDIRHPVVLAENDQGFRHRVVETFSGHLDGVQDVLQVVTGNRTCPKCHKRRVSDSPFVCYGLSAFCQLTERRRPGVARCGTHQRTARDRRDRRAPRDRAIGMRLHAGLTRELPGVQIESIGGTVSPDTPGWMARGRQAAGLWNWCTPSRWSPVRITRKSQPATAQATDHWMGGAMLWRLGDLGPSE